MIRRMISMNPELWKRLSVISEKRKKSGENCSVSELIRKAIIKFLEGKQNVRF